MSNVTLHPVSEPPVRLGPGRKAGAIVLRDARCKTGVIGISMQVCRARGDRKRLHRFYVVHCGPRTKQRCLRFNIDILGKNEAWRRALKVRAEHEERAVASSNQKGVIA
jgi:hypothetical protein